YSAILYMIIGGIGVPVFSQMTGGLGMLFGPTGGFIIGFIPTVYFIGTSLETTSFTIIHAILANIIGIFHTLTFGTLCLKIVATLTWMNAFLSGFPPFIVVGLIKAVLAGWIGIIVRNRLVSAQVLTAK